MLLGCAPLYSLGLCWEGSVEDDRDRDLVLDSALERPNAPSSVSDRSCVAEVVGDVDRDREGVLDRWLDRDCGVCGERDLDLRCAACLGRACGEYSGDS